MKTIEQRVLRGPNLWSTKSCLQSVVDLGELADCVTTDVPGFGSGLLALVPSLQGFAEPMKDGSFVAEVFGQLTLELQKMAGAAPESSFVAAVRGKGTHVKIIVAYRLEKLALQAFDWPATWCRRCAGAWSSTCRRASKRCRTARGARPWARAPQPSSRPPKRAAFPSSA